MIAGPGAGFAADAAVPAAVPVAALAAVPPPVPVDPATVAVPLVPVVVMVPSGAVSTFSTSVDTPAAMAPLAPPTSGAASSVVSMPSVEAFDASSWASCLGT